MLWSLALLPMLAGLLLFASGWQRRMGLATTAVAVLGLTLVLAILAARGGWTAQWTWSDVLTLRAMLTPLSAVVAITVPAIALPVLGYAAVHEERPGLGRLVAGLLFVGYRWLRGFNATEDALKSLRVFGLHARNFLRSGEKES